MAFETKHLYVKRTHLNQAGSWVEKFTQGKEELVLQNKLEPARGYPNTSEVGGKFAALKVSLAWLENVRFAIGGKVG